MSKLGPSRITSAAASVALLRLVRRIGLISAVLATIDCAEDQDARPAQDATDLIASSRNALFDVSCGDGTLNPGEACDDNNTLDGDGCDKHCVGETGYACTSTSPSVCTQIYDLSDGPAAYGSSPRHAFYRPTGSPFSGHDFWVVFPEDYMPTPALLTITVTGVPGTTISLADAQAQPVDDASSNPINDFVLDDAGKYIQQIANTYVGTHYGCSTQTNGIHLTASDDVRVIGGIERSTGGDAWGVVPTDKLANDWFAPTSVDAADGGKDQVTVVGTQPGTTVRIVDASDQTVYLSCMLDAGGSFTLMDSPNANSSFRVIADKPVGVITGNGCDLANFPTCYVSHEQVPAPQFWTEIYIVAPAHDQGSSAAISRSKVVALQNSTSVYIADSDGNGHFESLSAGGAYQLNSDLHDRKTYFLYADRPIIADSLISDGSSPWSFVLWQPLDGYLTSALVPAHGSGFNNFITIVTDKDSTTNVLLNNNLIPNWTEFAAAYAIVHTALPDSASNIISARNGATFGALIDGFKAGHSYAYSTEYDFAAGGNTTSYLGTNPPDYEASLTRSAAADGDDTTGTDDEDALPQSYSIHFGDSSLIINVSCNSRYKGVLTNANVYGWIDFDLSQTFEPGELASTDCNDPSSTLNGGASLIWSNVTYAAAGGETLFRMRICDPSTTCDTPTGTATSGEAEDHTIHIGVCGDGVVDHYETDPETCDDGNTSASDGCSATCATEAGYTCAGTPSACANAPAVNTPTNHSLTSSKTFSGSCITNAIVNVVNGQTQLCMDTCDAAGTYSCDASALPDGMYSTLSVTQTLHGTTSSATNLTLTLDTTPPTPPIITMPLNDAYVSNGVPSISGTCEDDANVVVKQGSTTLCNETCASGAFSCVAAQLNDGQYTLTATQTDLANNSNTSSAVTLNIDTSAPAAPSVSTPIDAAYVNDTTPRFSGTCEDNATVSVMEGSTMLCSAACSSSAFVCDATQSSEAVHTITVIQTDRAGNTNTSPVTIQITVDASQPAQPVIDMPSDMAPSADNRPTLSGACETGTTVDVLESASVLCTTSCANSAFSCRVTMLSDGDHSLIVRLTDAADNVSQQSATRHLSVDTMPPAAPTTSGPADGALTRDSTLTFTGSCEDNASVRVFEDNNVVCTTLCVSGLYSCESGSVTDGPHSYRVGQSDLSANVSETTPTFSIRVDTTPPATPIITSPDDDLLTSDATRAIVGDCETAATVSAYDGSDLLCTAACDNGRYSCKSSALSAGDHEITVNQTDRAGNVSVASAARKLTIGGVTAADAGTTAPRWVDDDCACNLVGARSQRHALSGAVGLLVCAAMLLTRIRRRGKH